VAVLAAVLASARASPAYEARVSWSRVPGAAGYKIYVRQDDQPFGPGTDVGMRVPDVEGAVHYVVAALDETVTNSFAVTSYDASGSESPRSNELALTYGDAAAVIDSDRDGLADAREDRDLDGVVDTGETDPHDPDTDGDGFSDGAEASAGSDPLDPLDPSGRMPALPLTG